LYANDRLVYLLFLLRGSIIPTRKEKKNKTKKYKTILIGFFSFPFKNFDVQNILKKNKWREIRDDRIFIFTYNQTWIVAATLLLLFLPSEKKEEDIDMDVAHSAPSIIEGIPMSRTSLQQDNTV
jgi:surface polysaccharide O-acyltransferase-like enzyme